MITMTGSLQWMLTLVATHESGHAVAAQVLGRPVAFTSIIPSEFSAGLTAYADTEDPDGTVETLVAAVVMAAGPIAEGGGCEEETEQARRLWPGAEYTAAEVLAHHRDDHLVVAFELEQRGRLFGDDLTALGVVPCAQCMALLEDR